MLNDDVINNIFQQTHCAVTSEPIRFPDIEMKNYGLPLTSNRNCISNIPELLQFQALYVSS